MIAKFEFEYEKKNLSMIVNDYHIASEMLKEQSFYEHWLLEFIRKNISGGTFVDIGANTGNHSIFFSLFCDCDMVISVEPLQSTFMHLSTNMITNGAKKMNVYRYAISDEKGIGYMTIPDKNEKSIGGTFLSGGIGEQVEVTTIDELLKDEANIRLIKIDVEGHEVKAIHGGLKTIEKHKPELFVEIFDEGVLQYITELLSQFGYEMKERYCYAPVYHFSTRSDIKRTFKP